MSPRSASGAASKPKRSASASVTLAEATAASAAGISLSDAAYEELKRRIIQLEMAPGLAFSEVEIAGELGYGRTPTREALSRLRREALVEVAPRSGYRVSGITLKGARDLFTVATVLAGEACSQVSQVPNAAGSLQPLERGCILALKDATKGSVARYLRAETEFHLALTKLTGNAMLEEMTLQVLEQIERLSHVMFRVRPATPIEHDHAPLLRAIGDGEPEDARTAGLAEMRSLQSRVFDAFIATDAITSAAIGLR